MTYIGIIGVLHMGSFSLHREEFSRSKRLTLGEPDFQTLTESGTTPILLQSPFAEARNCAGMSSERTCLLCNCYHETRGESINGMVAVGKVVKTRARSPLFPNSVCGVVKQRKQFSWWPGSRNEPLNDAAGVKKCEMAVGRIMNFNGFYALYYHNPSVRPKWAGRCKRLGKIGNHIFYKSCGKSDSKGNSKRRKTKRSRGAR